jgi:hypothetical protein
LFLFFGWFKKTKRENGRIVFDHANDPAGKNVIFGYLQIGQVWQYFLVTEEKNTRKEKKVIVWTVWSPWGSPFGSSPNLNKS